MTQEECNVVMRNSTGPMSQSDVGVPSSTVQKANTAKKEKTKKRKQSALHRIQSVRSAGSQKYMKMNTAVLHK